MKFCCMFSVFWLLTSCMLYGSCRLEEIRIDTTRLHRKTSEQFLAVTLDTHVFQKYWSTFSYASKLVKLQTLASALSPSIVRVGGTSSDFLIFDDGRTRNGWRKPSVPNTRTTKGDAGTLHYVPRVKRATLKDTLFDWSVYYPDELKKNLNNFTMTADMLDTVYQFVEKVGWNMTFDLNVLLRNQESWDPTNPTRLIDYVAKKGYRMLGWELGNEPNAFYHLVKFRLEPEQLAKDYATMKRILSSYKQFDNCTILGPSVTQLNKNWTDEFFQRFLSSGGKDVVTAATFHQYYLGSHAATQEDYTDPDVLNTLIEVVETGVNLSRAARSNVPLWLGETSSAVGSLQMQDSITYRAGFMWLDKLGVSASHGINVVVRQCFYGGINSLIARYTLNPRPDYWLTLLYKRLVGSRVLRVVSPSNTGTLRAYTHCTAARSGYGRGSVVVYVMNLYNTDTNLTFPDFSAQESIHLFSMEPKHGDLGSRSVLLNGQHLKMVNDSTLPSLLRPVRAQAPVTLKAYTYSFIVFPDVRLEPCL